MENRIMKKAFVVILAICLFSPLSLLAATPKKGKVTSVVKHGLTVRVKPTTKSKKTGTYIWAGDTFNISAVSGKWFKTTFKGVKGWVYSGKGYVKVIEYADDEDDDKKDKLPKLKESAQKAKVKKVKPTDKVVVGNIVDIAASSDNVQ